MSLRAGIARWWDEPDRFEWTTGLLRQRGLIRHAQVTMAVVSASAACVPLSVFLAPVRIGSAVVLSCLVAGVFTVVMSACWLYRWPSRRQSAVAVLLGIGCIVGWSATRTDASDAAMACTAMAITGAYIAFFHGPRMLALNFAVAVLVTTAASVNLYHAAGLQSALTAFWLVWFLNVSVPLVIWGVTQAMGFYAVRSESDPLTGLLNRRGFVDAVSAFIAAPESGAATLTVHMVDLDDFKRINDTHGHPVGDEVLRAVADLLREHAPTATICRAGGEEFLIASLSASSVDGRPLGVRICAAIAELSHAMTASIGSASASLEGAHGVPSFIEDLIRVADDAMYAAKRNGGNQAQHA
jgi:diguanylate cyclase (GGDEF)-like protein